MRRGNYRSICFAIIFYRNFMCRINERNSLFTLYSFSTKQIFVFVCKCISKLNSFINAYYIDDDIAFSFSFVCVSEWVISHDAPVSWKLNESILFRIFRNSCRQNNLLLIIRIYADRNEGSTCVYVMRTYKNFKLQFHGNDASY